MGVHAYEVSFARKTKDYAYEASFALLTQKFMSPKLVLLRKTLRSVDAMAFGITRKEMEQWKASVASREIAFLTHF